MGTRGTSGKPEYLIPTQACVVYDQRDGRIVHIHEFVPATAGGSYSLDELHTAAMGMASRLCGTEFLAIADAPAELVREPRNVWRVDLSTGELKAELETNTEEKHERRGPNYKPC
jgi:hypothetical protein